MALPSLPAGYSPRRLSTADAADAFEVYAADELADAGRVSIEPEDVESDWSRPSFDLAADAIAVQQVGSGRLAGAAEVFRGNRAEAAVLPGHRGLGIGSWLAEWVEGRARECTAPNVGQNAPVGSTADRFLERRGYEKAWDAWVFELPAGAVFPDRALPEGHRIRSVASPADQYAAHQVIEDAFAEWEGRVRKDYGDWAASVVLRRGFEPWQLRVVVDADDTAVAAAYTILGDSGCAFIDQLAVRADRRGDGLAQALLVDAFDTARARGATGCELSTDSRTGARTLYEKVGMAVRETWVHRILPL